MVEEGDDIGLWPFDGALVDLLESRSIVIVETYPTEFYGHLGFCLGSGKRQREAVTVGAPGGGQASPDSRVTARMRVLQRGP